MKKICYFNITYRCNESCVFCAANCQANSGKYAHKKLNDLTLGEFTAALDNSSVQRDDEIWISGGEPSLNPDFIAIISAACESSDFVWVSTTASCFTKPHFIAALDGSHNCLFDVRLYADNPAEHDALTVTEGSFEKTVQGIKALLRARASNSNLKYRVGVRLLLSNNTMSALSNTALFALNDLGVDKVSINMLIASSANENAEAFFPMGAAKAELQRLWQESNGDDRLHISGLPLCITPFELALRKMCSCNARPSGPVECIYYDVIKKHEPNKSVLDRSNIGIDSMKGPQCQECDANDNCQGIPQWYWSKYSGVESLAINLLE
ncbi:MAG: radical SAM protein [Nitrospirae bacterium]|nr:radical SAM protein [Nitrospirota bacterium]